MKRITAVLLAVLTLAMGMAARGETKAARIDLERIRLYGVGGESDGVVKLRDMGLTLAAGSVSGAPTVYTLLNYGDGQALESAVQLVDSQLLLALGGISGTYSIDLAGILDESAPGGLLTGALNTGFAMFSMNPGLVMDLSMPKNAKGVHTLTVRIPRKTYGKPVKRLIKALAGAGASEEELAALRGFLNESKKAFKLTLKYNPESTNMSLKITRNGKGILIKARMKITSEDMELIDPSADADRRDLLHLDAEAQTNLRDELDFLAMKFGFFAKTTRLDAVMGD